MPFQTKNTARCEVINNTGQKLYNLTVIHKYSDVYTDTLSNQGIVENNQKSPSFAVRYNTGLATGNDWWYIIWNSIGTQGGQLVSSDPHTSFLFDLEDIFRGAAENVGLVAGSAAGAAVGAITVAGAAATTALGGVFGAMAMEEITAQILAEGTRGYKQKTLKSKDAGKMVTITLNSTGGITISSPDGVSETQYKVEDLKFTGTEGLTKA